MKYTKKKRNDSFLTNHITYISLILIVISILLISAIILLMQQQDSDKQKDKTQYLKVIDPTICPDDINQGISIEIRRIHKRGIEEVMRTVGNKWKQSPKFYYQIELDSTEWDSNMIESWDTGYVGWESFYFTDEIQESIDITLNIIEVQQALFRSHSEIKESLQLTYDFRFGIWDGDDDFNDSDSYGHHVGDNYELWFTIHQMEPDGDDLSYWVENNILNTDPYEDDSKLDPDNDGIPTSWEYWWGYDPFCYNNHSVLDPDVDGLENIEEYQMQAWLANPFYKDIYIEVDFMKESPGLFSDEHILWKESQYMLIDEFIPHYISVHIDDGWPSGLTNGGGEELRFIEEYISPISGIMSEFYKYRFADERKGVFRYVAMVHSAGWCFAQTHQLWPDVITIPTSSEFFRSVYFPPALTPRLQRLATAVSIMHELGHSLNLNPSYHKGIDNESQVGRNNLAFFQKIQASLAARKYWDSYESCMNYDKFGKYLLGYSDGTHGIRDADDWEQIDLTFFQNSIDERYGIGSD